MERCEFVKLGDGKVVKLTAKIKDSIIDRASQWGEEESLRVLGFAVLESPIIPDNVESVDFAKYECGMTFVGLIGMLDPPRPEVRDAILACQRAGIRVIVITGDNKKTAESICRQIGVFNNCDGRSFTGREFDAMTLEEKKHAVAHASLFSRTEPTHKSQLVDLLKMSGHIVAMVFFVD